MSRFSYTGVSKIILLLFVFTLPAACSHYYVPKQYPVKAGMAPDFTGNKSIHIINAQETPNMKLIATQGFHKYLGDMQLWTNTAVGLLRDELESRNIQVTDTATKTIKLKITQANAYFGFATIRCILALEVETSEGHRKTFEGNNTSPWTLWRACDGAVTLAITAMLNDDEILRFIKY
ncbi:MAG: hypothetical protein JRJ27_18425 [Deltaproteobacteria bacterium]|nr:hypothetical protein [Deltaproteobacteria bacterium]